MLTGASAKRDDLVRNVVTRQVARVKCGTQFGRIVVELPRRRTPNYPYNNVPIVSAVWERTSVEVIHSC